jgi:hypothetical protein
MIKSTAKQTVVHLNCERDSDDPASMAELRAMARAQRRGKLILDTYSHVNPVHSLRMAQRNDRRGTGQRPILENKRAA